jgi:ribosomal protein S18 acetylase RimI-like enzyme
MADIRVPDISIRQAIAVDRPRLVPLINSAFAIETFLDGTRTNDEQLAAMMEKGTVLLAEDKSGCLLGSVYTERRGTCGYLGMLAVDPARQGSGIARRLMEEAEGRFRAQGCEAIEIIVLSLRADLPPIYERFGFVEIRREEFTPVRSLRPGFECHGIVMSKRL